MKCYFLYFDTNDIAHLIKSDVRDGIVEIGDKAWSIPANRKPILFKRGFSTYPFYMIKWDNVYPAKLVEVAPDFKETDEDINPEILAKERKLKILGNMLKVKRPVSPLLMIILGIMFGVFLAYFLFALKIIVI